jgi:hypothetical protein
MHSANGSTSLQISLVVAVGLVTASIASAQGVGRVSGRATDPSEAVIPGAAISAPNTSTNVVSESESDSTGTTRCSYLQEIIW